MVKCRKGENNADATTIRESKKIFRFANAKSNDIFYDLGCGFATPCIVGIKNFNMKKVVGVESCDANFLEATKRIMEEGFTDKIWLWNEGYENIDMKDATLVYFLLEQDYVGIKHLENSLIQNNCRIITVEPIPSIIPSKMMKISNSEFFLTKCPLRKHKARSPDHWAISIPKKNFRNFDDYCNDYKLKNNDKDEKDLRKLMTELYKK